MSGLSDVRVVLHSHDLQVQHRGTRLKNCAMPAGFTRWQWFWHCQRTRRQLQELSTEQLRDIGLSTQQAHNEAMKSFWQR